jgi:hypothetical protein
MTAAQAIAKLDELVTLRGSISHRVAATRKVLKKDVTGYIEFVNRLAVQTSNEVRKLLLKSTGKEPWAEFAYESIEDKQEVDDGDSQSTTRHLDELMATDWQREALSREVTDGTKGIFQLPLQAG